MPLLHAPFSRIAPVVAPRPSQKNEKDEVQQKHYFVW